MSQIDFGKGFMTSAGDEDVFVAKFTPAGAAMWSKRFGGALDQRARGVTVDPYDATIFAGYFYGSIDLGQGQFTPHYMVDAFIAKQGP